MIESVIHASTGTWKIFLKRGLAVQVFCYLVLRATLLDRSPGCQLVDRHRLASHYVWSLLQGFQRRLWTLPVQGQVTTQVAATQRGLTSGVNAQGVSVHQTSSSSSFQAPALITDKSQQRWHRAHHMLLELASKAGSLLSACFAQDTWQLETPDQS